MSRVVFGIRPVEELLRARPREVAVVYIADGTRHSKDLERAVAAAKDRGVAVEVRGRALVAGLAKGAAHQGIVAIGGEYRYAEMAEILAAADASGQPPLLLLLDGITDQHNLGALVRSAEVLGAHGVIVPDKAAAPVAGAVKASAGATERMLIARVANLIRTIDALRERGIRVWGAAAEKGEPLAAADLKGPTALVVGSEGRGMREAVARRCDGLLRIPQRGSVASLNASVAGAILLYETTRQRGLC